ncbi:DNA polymerase bacteriophage-type [Candidatus Kinetoplastibacterium desouzaii TCC079E]|uniref:Type-4 uracil-DNA glycosylase n=1 Tax=Candidatus Kinetoplastidibacterium desouzai TCC079E TaxID=1208919 RepID=M1M481_9PROT|nr:uracil-DNA glycosylase [Candidatus Kinetoplastibacterium desouzaii]AGF47035.1 DNA polymerase bacteriophage-type [Candidatus Kinetoplastibacterium desouzaii TCC079E]
MLNIPFKKKLFSDAQYLLLKEIGINLLTNKDLNCLNKREIVNFIKEDLLIKNVHQSNENNDGDFSQSLKSNILNCKSCSLCNSRKNVVVGSGSTSIGSWMIIGEAPGEQEDLKGMPFAGKSGNLLDEMLRSVGIIDRSECFITNVVKCRPPGNRNPRTEEVEECRPFLLEQINLLKPSKIIVLGKIAANAILSNKNSIGELRGRVHYFISKDSRRIPVIVSYHPAYLLRRPEEKHLAWDDLCLAISVH